MDINWCTRNGFSMQGVPLLANKACVSLLAVSPLIKMIFAPSSGRFFWIQACTSAPFISPGIRMSEITPPYCPPERCFSPSAPEDAFTTAYPLRSSAALRNAITDGSSSINRYGSRQSNGRRQFHRPASFAAMAGSSAAMGIRTTNVLPPLSALFQHKISPPCARTIP